MEDFNDLLKNIPDALKAETLEEAKEEKIASAARDFAKNPDSFRRAAEMAFCSMMLLALGDNADLCESEFSKVDKDFKSNNMMLIRVCLAVAYCIINRSHLNADRQGRLAEFLQALNGATEAASVMGQKLSDSMDRRLKDIRNGNK